VNKEALTTLGLVLAVGLVKDFTKSGSFSKSDVEEVLRQHFAIKAGKKIPQTYITHELERLTVLPLELRTPEQNKIVSALEAWLTSK
jgi:hypothetical protein